MKTTLDFSELKDVLPEIIWRHRWNRLAEKIGLPFKAGTLANLDSENRGPNRVYFGRKVGYRRDDLIEWLQTWADNHASEA